MYPSFLPGTDSLSKYLLTIGFVLIFFAIIYPLQKEDKLKLEQLNLLMEQELLSQDINEIIEKIKELEADSKKLSGNIKSLELKLKAVSLNDSMSIEKRISEEKSVFLRKVDDADIIAASLQKKSTQLRFELKKQEEMNAQINSYKWFKWIFLCAGSIFIFLGFRFWLSSTYLEETEKCVQYNQHTQAITSQQQASPPYESAFIRIRTCIKKNTTFIRRWIKI